MKNLKRVLRQRLGKDKPGQSLVEMAIMTPLLLIMFIGVLEVGWALRGYLVLVNVNREAARYGVKNQVLDYSIKDVDTVGYNVVLSHTTNSLTEQLPLEFLNNPNSTIIMSHFVVDTKLPCAKKLKDKDAWPPYEFDPTCDCESKDDPFDPKGQWFTDDDTILYPGKPGWDYYAITYGKLTDSNGLTRTTRLDYEEEARNLALENNQLNCAILKTGSASETSANNVFSVETFYDQPQLVGVPFISNSVTDPVPFYTHTAMRITDCRDCDSIDTVGPLCAPYPIIFPETILDDPDNPSEDQPIDAFEGDGTGNFGWLNWNPKDNSNVYLIEELYNPSVIFDPEEGFKAVDPSSGKAASPEDTALNLGDFVSGSTGVNNSSGVQAGLDALVNTKIMIPVYDPAKTTGTGANKAYYISHFAEVTITKVCLPSNKCGQDLGLKGSDKVIYATFHRYVDDACKI